MIPAFKFRNDSWPRCIDFVKTLVNGKNHFQKKGYKFLNEILEKVHYTFLDEITELLVESGPSV